MRSSIPPCPSTMFPQSFAPSDRLTADSTSPPANPASTIASACTGAKGVSHQSAPPRSVAAVPPPTNPSQVLFGLTRYFFAV